jgi:predicted GIY-YIG superfamily endonuclease
MGEAIMPKARPDLHIFIYSLTDPINNEVFYIGQSRKFKDRRKSHIQGCHSRTAPKDLRISALLTVGLMPLLSVLEECLEAEAGEREAYYIEMFKSLGHNLCNRRRPPMRVHSRGDYKIICVETGELYTGYSEAAHIYHCSPGTIKNSCDKRKGYTGPTFERIS